MSKTLQVFGILLVATLLFHTALNFMVDNIEDFETVALPPKKVEKITTAFPTLKVDATSRESWTLVDFSTGKQYPMANLYKNRARLQEIPWDLGFQRTKVVTNSGETNPKGTVAAANLGPIPFDQLQEVPQPAELVQDTRSFGNLINPAISDWYNYRTRTHNVESKKNVYLIRTHEGRYLKLRFLNYYCSREDEECRTVMCSRDEAACITLEYQLTEPGSVRFPKAPPPQMVQKTKPDPP